MTRDSRTLSAVFMAVLLILASGTAVSLAVTGDSATDTGTNAAAMQETTTVEDDGAEETTREADEPADGDRASVTMDDQETEGEQVVIESVTMPEGGFVAIHDSSVSEAPISSVLGNSVYLEAGTHEDVTITLARPIEESQTLVAMPHLDTNDNQVYDFVLSTGELDGPYTTDGEVVIDSANVTVPEETTTTTTEEEEETTPEEEVTTVPEEEETTPEEEVTTVPEEEETTPEEEVTTVPEEEETTEVVEEPAEQQQFVFKIEQMQIDEWSFVVGDEETPDRTETISNINVQDRRVEINLTEVLRQSAAQQDLGQMTTVSPEEAEEQLEENLSKDIQTVRFVIRNVNVENVTLVVTAPEDVDLPQPPMTTVEEPEEETPTEEEETPTEEEETPTEEEETPTEEEETPTEEEETPTEEEETPTPEEAELDSFEVSGLDAPESATAGDTIEVSATLSNPNDQEATQDVAFRLEGTVIDRQSVTLDAEEQTTVTFEIDTEGVPAGQYIHGVYTRNFGDLAIIVIEEPDAETTAAEGTETPAGDETTVQTTTEA
ncbi:DUF7282 domain-containing protein [Halorussus salinisoli]|uniref:DUF7282 domain-containing protein n=1 Tax=Halorussus salinisoli TaxID=2558242 RepID=UPI0010C1A559|nr:hypothetical protein [Halorussus salinisoli]